MDLFANCIHIIRRYQLCASTFLAFILEATERIEGRFSVIHPPLEEDILKLCSNL
ncbi:unnamed protein product [Chondrus crispus]|uniref:Uncharacterized protein n=1 Tax=Chondrus crispus TaxID=2769 RepID=R7QDD1_CHOCR|nr:unnamed protein product [Chondrus crispus]CDF36497.1 unnamed protein product [Chondrus crispus]|eukprot:XP_005716316.1 unnamed protein product [Chondrus crispus]